MKKWKSKDDKKQQDPSSIKLPPIAHVPIARCRVQLLGRAAPTDTTDGFLAMQKPLYELYENYSPVQSILTAYTSGLVLRTPADVETGAEELWFPIQDLLECGAVRAVGGDPPTSFAPLSSPEARGGKHPALFVFIFKRRDIPVSDCWAVECKSDNAAKALLSACMLAHKNPAGWASTVDRPPPTLTNRQLTAKAPPSEEWDGAAAKEAALWSNKYRQDYYEKPPLQGFFYTPRTDLIQHYVVNELDEEESLIAEDGDWQSIVEAEDAEYLGAGRPHRMPVGPGCCVRPEQANQYGFPPGMAGTFVPEDLVFADSKSDKRDSHSSGSDTDSSRGKKHKKHKKKKKKSKHRKGKKIAHDAAKNGYNYYADDNQVMIVPQDAMYVHGAPSVISEEAFESHLPEPVDHYVVGGGGYDPSWEYDMKEYIRSQQHVNGFTDPISHRPYESHIDEFPPVDYMDDPADDDGPYEHHLPVTAGAGDPRMLNSNFIIRQKEDFRRQL